MGKLMGDEAFLSMFILLLSVSDKGIEAYMAESGVQAEGQDYTISCSSGYFISIYYATWGADYSEDGDTNISCWDTDSTANLQSECADINPCSFQWNSSVFGDPCPGITKSGEVRWHCGRNAGWSEWSTWTKCPVLCGGGTSSRTRLCDNPAHEYPGSYCDGSSFETATCNDHACPENTQLVNHRGPWRLVFKAPSGVTPPSHGDVGSFFRHGEPFQDGIVSAMSDFSQGGSFYRSTMLDKWNTDYSISAVRLSVYKDGREVAYVVFDTSGLTSHTEWMNCSRVIDSSWTDLKWANPDFCHIDGTGSWKRNFFISNEVDGCYGNEGWLMLKDIGAEDGCDDWDSTTVASPYILFSPGKTSVAWQSGNMAFGDALALFVMDWHMVFKGVTGIVPNSGSLSSLWEDNVTENDNETSVRTITESPGLTYKSGLIEKWSNAFIIMDLVKYSHYNNSEEKAWVVFNGRDTDKLSWFSSSRILYSGFTDMATEAKSTCSITGERTRTFSIINQDDGCSSLSIWMLVIDNSSESATCSFDADIRPKPYFLYSSSQNRGYPESEGKWNSDGFPTADVLGVFAIGWFPLLKVSRGQSVSPALGIYDLWTGTYVLNEFDENAMSFQSGTPSFKSSVVDLWDTFYIPGVRVSFYKSGVEQAYIVFDAHGTNKTSWFDCARILYTSYQDLNRDTHAAFCSVDGDFGADRHFFLEYEYDGCDRDTGWFGVVERSSGCAWETKADTPYALYSDNSDNFEANLDMSVADVFTISVAMEDHCRLVSCENGGSCYDRGMTYDCECVGDFYGIQCEKLDGGWTEWSNWTMCSTTCFAVGSQTRTRNCTNPSRVGLGLDCIGEAYETVECIPDLPICNEYLTGYLDAGEEYKMVCPVSHYVYVDTAFYGNVAHNCTDPLATSKLQTLCHGRSENCTFSFSNIDFGNPCWRYQNLGNATLFCARDGVWSTWESWSYCSLTCGGGVRTRQRTCDDPMPISPGLYCSDSPNDSKICMTDPCPVCGNHFAGYDVPSNISIYNDTDTTGHAYMLPDINWDIPCCEVISAWEFVPITSGLIDFHVWRQESNGMYKLASSISYLVNDSEVGQLVNFTLPRGERHTVRAGDDIGWYNPGINMIPYAECSGELCPDMTRRSPFSQKPSKGTVFNWEDAEILQDKAYAIRFYTQPNTVPYVNQTVFSALVKDSSPTGSKVLPYWITDDDVDDLLYHSFSHDLFELNTSFTNDIHIQTKTTMPKDYNVFSLILKSWDSCSNTATTTLEVVTYNAPPVFFNLPDELTISENVGKESMLFELDVADLSENDTVCCTLAEVIPGSANFELVFIDSVYRLYTTKQATFDNKEITNYYKIRFCCSDSYGVSSNFLEVHVTDVRNKKSYTPPSWFLTAIAISLVPVTLLLLTTCCLLFTTFFAEPDVEYFYSR